MDAVVAEHARLRVADAVQGFHRQPGEPVGGPVGGHDQHPSRLGDPGPGRGHTDGGADADAQVDDMTDQDANVAASAEAAHIHADVVLAQGALQLDEGRGGRPGLDDGGQLGQLVKDEAVHMGGCWAAKKSGRCEPVTRQQAVDALHGQWCSAGTVTRKRSRLNGRPTPGAQAAAAARRTSADWSDALDKPWPEEVACGPASTRRVPRGQA